MSQSAEIFAQKNGSRFVEELKELLRIPSISTDPARVGDVRRAAEFSTGSGCGERGWWRPRRLRRL